MDTTESFLVLLSIPGATTQTEEGAQVLRHLLDDHTTLLARLEGVGKAPTTQVFLVLNWTRRRVFWH